MGDVQVQPEHYGWSGYNTTGRWASYWHQIDEIVSAGVTSCLEIGTGSGVVRDVLRARGVSVTTVDIDPTLRCDRVGDVRQLPCADGEFDAVLCCQVLEHIPWAEVPVAVSELHRVSRSLAIVSVPQSGLDAGISLRLRPLLPDVNVALRIGRPWRHRFDGQHHWQVGCRGTSRAAVRAVLAREFELEREYTVPAFTYHRFYVLRPRSAASAPAQADRAVAASRPA